MPKRCSAGSPTGDPPDTASRSYVQAARLFPCLSAIVSPRRVRASRTGAAWSVGFVHGFIQAVGLWAYASEGACVAEAEKEEVRQHWSVLSAVSGPHEPMGV